MLFYCFALLTTAPYFTQYQYKQINRPDSVSLSFFAIVRLRSNFAIIRS